MELAGLLWLFVGFLLAAMVASVIGGYGGARLALGAVRRQLRDQGDELRHLEARHTREMQRRKAVLAVEERERTRDAESEAAEILAGLPRANGGPTTIEMEPERLSPAQERARIRAAARAKGVSH